MINILPVAGNFGLSLFMGKFRELRDLSDFVGQMIVGARKADFNLSEIANFYWFYRARIPRI